MQSEHIKNNLLVIKNDIFSNEISALFQEPGSSPLILVDDSCNIIYSSDSFKKIFRLTDKKQFFDLTFEPDLVPLLKTLIENNYKSFQFDLFILQGDEPEESHYNAQIERIKLKDLQFNVMVFSSLMEKSKFEQRINNLDNALEYGKFPVMLTDKQGMVKYATTSFENILKLSIEEIFNRHLQEVLSLFLTLEEKQQLGESIDKGTEWSKAIISNTEKEIPKYYELKLRPAYMGNKSDFNFILSANDITDYVMKNLLIKRSETKLRSIINNISDLLLIFQKKQDTYFFETANDNFCKLFSIKKDKVSNKNLATLIDKLFFQQIQLSIQEFYLNNSEVVEFKYNTADEKTYSAKITHVEMKSFEETLYILSMQDITEQVLSRKNLEIAYRKEINLNKMKTTFLENVSHEIRTPFNAIVGYSDIIDESIKENDYEAVVNMASAFKDVLGRVLKLFTNIVEVFHISSGELELDYVSLNINQVLKSVYNKRIDETKEKSVEFILDVDAHDLIIETDWIKFETVINSLVDNAIKYTEKGSIKISSCLEHNKVKITIADTGIGIKTDNISRLYEPFVQEEDSSYMRNYEGAGLGLTIAYKLTQILGGEFNIKSKENRGTQITLKFPVIINASSIKESNKI